MFYGMNTDGWMLNFAYFHSYPVVVDTIFVIYSHFASKTRPCPPHVDDAFLAFLGTPLVGDAFALSTTRWEGEVSMVFAGFFTMKLLPAPPPQVIHSEHTFFA